MVKPIDSDVIDVYREALENKDKVAVIGKAITENRKEISELFKKAGINLEPAIEYRDRGWGGSDWSVDPNPGFVIRNFDGSIKLEQILNKIKLN